VSFERPETEEQHRHRTVDIGHDLAGLTELGYCGPGDPGSTAEVSPVEATEAATRSF